MTLYVFPDPILIASPFIFDFAAQINASTISETNVKSLVCFPSPTTVKGLFASFWAKKTPKTAPYVPEVLERGP